MGLPFPSSSRALALLAGLAALATLAVAGRIVQPAHASPPELFFSEYVEGSSSNKALEIHNGTGAPVTLTGSYDVQVFANGSPTATATIPLTGTVADGDVFVLARSAAVAAILAQADQTTTNFLWNGNDAVALRKAGAIVDVIGQVGADPGVEWGSGDATTADHTLRRKPVVQAGDPDGSDVFDPSSQWVGFPIDSFDGLGSHTISTGGGGSNQAPDAVGDSAEVDEDGDAITVPVLTNDTDPDGDALSISAVGDAAHGTVAIAGNAVSYAPEVDFNGTDSFTYTVSDGRGGEDTATVSVIVTPVNDDPEPEDDVAVLPEDGSATIDVLANDTDPDDDTPVVSAAAEALHGTVSVAPGGTGVVYVPEPNFNGEDAFEYTVSDGAV